MLWAVPLLFISTRSAQAELLGFVGVLQYWIFGVCWPNTSQEPAGAVEATQAPGMVKSVVFLPQGDSMLGIIRIIG